MSATTWTDVDELEMDLAGKTVELDDQIRLFNDLSDQLAVAAAAGGHTAELRARMKHAEECVWGIGTVRSNLARHLDDAKTRAALAARADTPHEEEISP
jgi:hypothetical protein